MTNRVLWLLSYIGLSLALALGNNRQTTLGGSRANEEHRAVLAASASSPATGGRLAYRLQDEPTATRHTARNALHDWLVYDKRTGPEGMLSADRLVLLDDVLSTVLGNFYRQQQRHRQLPSQGSSSAGSHPLSFLYDEEDDDEEDEADDDDDDDDNGDDDRGESRMMLRSSHERPLLDSSPAAMYVETLAPNRARSGTGLLSDRTAVRRSLGTSESRGLGVGLSVPYNLEQPSVAPKPPGKRNSAARLDISKEAHQQQQQQVPASAAVAAAGASMASQFMLRSARGNRQYDVPQIECPQSDDGMERFACPTADRMGRYRCIDDHVLCDGFIDCPTGEDEDRQACMFYKTTKAHLDVLADALLRWARGR